MNIEKGIKYEEWFTFFKAVIQTLKKQYKNSKNLTLTQQAIAQAIDKDAAMLSNLLKGKTSGDLFEPYYYLIKESFNFIVTNFDREHKVVELKLLDESTDVVSNLQIHHYIYYYIPHLPRQTSRFFTIAKAHLSIQKNQNKAILKFFRKGTNEVISTNRGKLIPAGDQLAIFFNPQKKEHQDPSFQHPSLIYLSGGWNDLGNKFLSGTFAAYGPSCGLFIIQSKPEEEIYLSVSKDMEDIPESVISMLINKRIEPLEVKGVSELNDTFAAHLTKSVKPFEGTYEMFTLESRIGRESIHKLRLEIFGGCRIRLYSAYYQNGKTPFEGYIVDVQNNSFSCYFTYKHHRGIFRNKMILSMNPAYLKSSASKDGINIPENLFVSIYAGTESDNSPIGGRAVLRKTENINFEPSTVKLNSITKIHNLFTKHPYLRPFLRGELDEFTDSPVLLKKHNLLDRSDSRAKDLKKFVGTFFNYRLYNDKKSIHVRPMKIYDSGIVKIYNRNEEGIGPIYSGRAEIYGNNILSIFINDRNGKPYYSHMLFFAGAFPTLKSYCIGISTIYTINGNLRAGREILLFENHQIEKKHFRKQIIIQEKGKMVDSIKDLDKKMPGFHEYLTDPNNNFFTISPSEPFNTNKQTKS